MERKLTKKIMVGSVPVGGGAPVSIQSMLNTRTTDVDGCLAQIRALAAAGCEIARLAVPDMEAAEAFGAICTASPLPLVADIHFDYRLAIRAAENGAAKIRINPGNIGGEEKVKAVADICRRAEINRGTFYLHCEDKYALLDALIDEALAAAPPLEGVESATLCQRPPADDDYRLLYSDSDAYARVAQRVIERGAEQMVPWVMEKTGLSREDAFLLFVHNVQGNLAVNRLLGWRRGPEFAHAQELLNAYSEGGLLAVSALRDSDNPS